MTKPICGMSLIELLVVVAVLGIITAITVPAYNGYIQTARQSVIMGNMKSIQLFQEERRIDRGEYIEGEYDPDVPDSGLGNALGWMPEGDGGVVTYVVTCETDGESQPECAKGSGYTITGTDNEGGAPVVLVQDPKTGSI